MARDMFILGFDNSSSERRFAPASLFPWLPSFLPDWVHGHNVVGSFL